MNTTWIVIICAIILAIIIVAIVIRFIRRNRGTAVNNNNQVYVGNIPYSIRDYDLKNIFSQYGTVKQIRMMKNSRTGRSKGFAFVTFSRMEEANNALAAHGQDMRGRAIVVRIAKPPRHE